MRPPLWGPDKLAHAVVTALAVFGGWFIARWLGFGDLSLLAGIFFAFVLGYGKEWFDAKHGKEFSRQDLAADGAGAALAALAILLGSVA